MALADTALTTVALASSFAGVATLVDDDTTIFESLINAVSASISSYCGRIFGRSTGLPEYTETLSASNRQLLLLSQWPISSITSITSDGYLLVLDTDYRCDPQDKARGEVYRENGWKGLSIVTGLTQNVVATERNIVAVYKGGYILPADASFTPSLVTGLPFDIVETANNLVAIKYWSRKRQGFGLSSLKEGGVSYSFIMASPEVTDVLNRYKRWL